MRLALTYLIILSLLTPTLASAGSVYIPFTPATVKPPVLSYPKKADGTIDGAKMRETPSGPNSSTSTTTTPVVTAPAPVQAQPAPAVETSSVAGATEVTEATTTQTANQEIPGTAIDTTQSSTTASSGYTPYNQALNSQLTSQLISQLGQPGFYVSKFLNFRKQLTQPACAPSQVVNKISVLTSLTGDVVTHGFDYFENKKIKKKFEDKLAKIQEYQANLQSQHRKILDYDDKSPDLQVDTLNYLKDVADIDVKRAEMVRAFTLVGVGLNLTSQVLAYLEATAETATGGTAAAQTNSCITARQAEQAALEAAATAKLNGVVPEASGPTAIGKIAAQKEDTTPWYLMPVLYLAKGLSFIEQSDTYKDYRSYRRTSDKGTNMDAALNSDEVKNSLTGDTASKAGQVLQIADSAAYAEEMIVNMVMEVIKQWRQGKNPKDAEADINGLNKGPSDSGIMKFFKSLGLEEVAIRYAVRSLIKANLVIVDKFMRSAVGRIVNYAFNIYMTYRIIAEAQAQVAYAKERRGILERTIKGFTKTTTWTPIPALKNIFDSILPSAAYADVNPKYIFPAPPCHAGIVVDCSTKRIELLPKSVLPYFNSLPKNVQSAQNSVFDKSYSIKIASKLAAGNASYEEIDSNKLQAEITNLENYASKLEKILPKNNQLLKDKDKLVKEMSNEVIFPKVMLASYSKSNPADEIKKLGVNLKSLPAELVKNTNLNKNESVATRPETVPAVPSQEALKSESRLEQLGIDTADIKTISSKESDIFEIISHRYIEMYKRQHFIMETSTDLPSALAK